MDITSQMTVELEASDEVNGYITADAIMNQKRQYAPSQIGPNGEFIGVFAKGGPTLPSGPKSGRAVGLNRNVSFFGTTYDPLRLR